MGRVLIGYPNYADDATLSDGTWESTLPQTNVQDRKLSRVARSTDDTPDTATVRCDLGEALACRLVASHSPNLEPGSLWWVRGWASWPMWSLKVLSAWTDVNSPVVTSSQTDPFGKTDAYLIEDNNGSAYEGKYYAVTFTGDGAKTVALCVKAGTATASIVGIYDASATTWRHAVLITWSGGVPTLATNTGSGTIADVVDLGNGWYYISFTAESVVAANNNQYRLYAAGPSTSDTGSTYFYEATAWNAITDPHLYNSGIVEFRPSGLRIEEAYHRDFGAVVAFDEVDLQYLQIEWANAGSAPCDIGRLAVCGGWQPAVDMDYGARLSFQSATRRRVTDGGAANYVTAPVRRVLTFACNELTETEAFDVFDIQRLVGTDQQIYVVYDQDDVTRRSFFGTFKTLSRLETLVASKYGVPFVVEEEL